MRTLRCAAALAAASALVLTGCSSGDPLADQYREGSGKNYVGGDGTITEIDQADRGEIIEFSGTSIEGDSIESGDYAGEALVVNFWYASCAPCRAEAPDLRALSEELAGVESADGGAQVIGVNVRDQAGTAASFEKTYGITYPSILDADDGTTQLAFSGTMPPNAVPTTLVLDREHRVAARILGRIQAASIVTSLVGDVLAEEG